MKTGSSPLAQRLVTIFTHLSNFYVRSYEEEHRLCKQNNLKTIFQQQQQQQKKKKKRILKNIIKGNPNSHHCQFLRTLETSLGNERQNNFTTFFLKKSFRMGNKLINLLVDNTPSERERK